MDYVEAEYAVADPNESLSQTQHFLSYKFIDDCIKEKTLLDPVPYILKKQNRVTSGRIAYTRAEDERLLTFLSNLPRLPPEAPKMDEKDLEKLTLKGNKVYKIFADLVFIITKCCFFD